MVHISNPPNPPQDFTRIFPVLSIANLYYHRLNDYPFHTAPDSGCRTTGSSSYPENDPSQQYASRSLQLNSVYSAPQPSYSLHHIHNSDLHPDLSGHLAFGQHTRLKDMIGRTTEVTCAPLQVIRNSNRILPHRSDLRILPYDSQLFLLSKRL